MLVVTLDWFECEDFSSSPLVVKPKFVSMHFLLPSIFKVFHFFLLFYLKISRVFMRKNTCKNPYNRNPVNTNL
jgi:hypothetical protein